jgi:DP-EP family
MPDQTVRVTFDEQAVDQFTFRPDSVKMTAAGKVIFNRDGKASWTFVGAVVKNDPQRQFTTSVNPGGEVMQVNDAYKQMGRFKYNITVSKGGKTFTSPDPEIVNEPPQ